MIVNYPNLYPISTFNLFYLIYKNMKKKSLFKAKFDLNLPDDRESLVFKKNTGIPDYNS